MQTSSTHKNTHTGKGSGTQMDAQALMQELLERHQQMLAGLNNLYNIKDVKIGCTEFKTIYSRDKLSLRFYPALNSKPIQLRAPLLMVYALVNRPDILDLQPDRSLIRSLNELGLDVYLIDWGYPDAADCFTDLDDYINDYIDDCVDACCQHYAELYPPAPTDSSAQTTQVNLLGICQGGTFSLCYNALHPDKVAGLITMVTPVDFDTADNRLGGLLRNLDLQGLRTAPCNLPGSMLHGAFQSLTPIRQGLQKAINLPKTLADESRALNFLSMEKWLQHSPDLCHQAFVEFIEDFYQQNKLVEGKLSIGGQSVNLSNISQPVLNLYAQHDHLVPPASSQALKQLANNADYAETCYDCGHIGIFVGKKALETLPKQIVTWLQTLS